VTVYLVIDHTLTRVLRGMPEFKLNLGMNALNADNKFVATDPIVGHHARGGGNLLHRIGNIGSIAVYVDEQLRPYNLRLIRGRQEVARSPQPHELTDCAAYLEGMLHDLLKPLEQTDETGR
jgi:hypothetical protein